jgi:hypothetical protein
MLKYIYLVLALVALVVCWYYNLLFIAAGHGLMDFIAAPSVNHATQSLAFDLLVATLAGSIWMVVEGKRVGIRHAWIYIVVSFVVAFGFAFPLFLFHRECSMTKTSKPL